MSKKKKVKSEYVEIKEMIAETEKQLEKLNKFLPYDSLDDISLFRQREDVLSDIANLYAYKNIKEGYAITSTEYNPITPIREKILNITQDVLSTELNKAGNLDYSTKVSSNKGYLHIMVRISAYEDDLTMDMSRIIGRISVYTNEFKIYSNNKPPNDPSEYQASRMEMIKKEERKLNFYKTVLNETGTVNETIDSFNKMIEINTPKNKKKKYNLYDKILTFIELKAIRGDEYRISKVKESIEKANRAIEHFQNDIERSRREYKIDLKLNKLIGKEEDLIREKLFELGYEENNEKYFAYS